MATIPAYQSAKFLLSVNHIKQLPSDQGHEVAFIGRSNAGKSSALNALTQNRQLARVSKTPGRTQMINFFILDEEHRLVDLPGYGYAKVPLAVKEKWQQLLSTYLEIRKSLKGLVLLMDIRHPLKELDKTVITWALNVQLPIHILLTKADKLKRHPAMNTLRSVQQALKAHENLVTIQLFSAIQPLGIDELREKLNSWME